VWEDINDLFSYYRQPAGSAPAIVASVGRPFYSVATGHPTRESIPVYFIGVWETVGALGIPDDMALANLLDDPKKYAFHDTSLSPIVEHARHALALDEQRQSFIPTLWDNVADNPKVKQRWFAGVHADV
ncbi:phospholipase effector Tle1 domain-containing protein, partial [Enterobacter asburiae]